MIVKSVDIGWVYYDTSEFANIPDEEFDDDRFGKWMYFYRSDSDLSKIDSIAKYVVENDYVNGCKFTNPDRFDHDKFIAICKNDGYNLMRKNHPNMSLEEYNMFFQMYSKDMLAILEEKYNAQMKSGGVMNFYLYIDDFERHKKILRYMIDNGLINRCKDYSLHNISYKLNLQTRKGYYGKIFNGDLTLNKLIDLKTGEWIYKG